MISLKQKTITGIGWSSVGNVGRQILQFVVSVILARLLTPEDFGLIGMVIVFTGLATLFTDLGFSTALIQKSDIDEEHRSSVFWLNLFVGLIITAVIIIIAPFIAAFYGEPRLTLLVRVISINFFIGAFGIVQKTLFSRGMNFRTLAIIDFLTIFLAGAVAIALAVFGYGVWSLVFQLILTTLISTILFWVFSNWTPKFAVHRQALQELWGFSSNLMGAQFLNYGVRNMDYLLIGRFVGSAPLGIYTRAYTTMLLPLNQVTSVVGRVMFPALAQIQHDVAKVKRVYLLANRIIALVTIPLIVGLFVVAEPFVLTLYGAKWVEVVPILQILCLVGLKQPIGSTSGWIYQSQGRTDLMFRWQIVSVTVTIISFFIGIRWGIIGVAYAYAIRSYLIWYPAVKIPGQLIDLTFVEFIRNVAGVFFSAVAMGLVTWAIGLSIPTEWAQWLKLVVQVAVGMLTYFVVIHFCKIQAYIDVRLLVLEQWQKLKLKRVPNVANNG